jgi:hypothetical protein
VQRLAGQRAIRADRDDFAGSALQHQMQGKIGAGLSMVTIGQFHAALLLLNGTAVRLLCRHLFGKHLTHHRDDAGAVQFDTGFQAVG